MQFGRWNGLALVVTSVLACGGTKNESTAPFDSNPTVASVGGVDVFPGTGVEVLSDHDQGVRRHDVAEPAPAHLNAVDGEVAPLWDALGRCDPLLDTDTEDKCAARVQIMDKVREISSDSASDRERTSQLRAALVDKLVGRGELVIRRAAADAHTLLGVRHCDETWPGPLVDALRRVDGHAHQDVEPMAIALGGLIAWCDDAAARKQLVALMADKTLRSTLVREELIKQAAFRASSSDEGFDGPSIFVKLDSIAHDTSEPDSVRQAAIAGIRLGVADASEPVLFQSLVKLTADPRTQVRFAAIKALGQVGEQVEQVQVRARLMEILRDPDADGAAMELAAATLSSIIDTPGLEGLVAWYQADRARPGVTAAMTALLLGLPRHFVTSAAVATRTTKTFDTLLADPSVSAAQRVALMLALGDRTGAKLSTCKRFLSDADPEVNAAAAQCLARAEDTSFSLAGVVLSPGTTRVEVLARIGEEGRVDEESWADVVNILKGFVPARRGAVYFRWSTGGIDDFILVFVNDKLTDIVWPSSTAGPTDLQQAFQDDLEDRFGQSSAEPQHQQWSTPSLTIKRSCWLGGDSGDSGCAYAILGRGR